MKWWVEFDGDGSGGSALCTICGASGFSKVEMKTKAKMSRF